MRPEYKVDHLLLLVGYSPLPNAIAGKLLIDNEGTVTLLHSDGAAETAGHLRRALQGWRVGAAVTDVRLTRIDESDPSSIAEGVQKALEGVRADRGTKGKKTDRVGLHYTGGTKAMAVHAYRAAEAWAQQDGNLGATPPVFSYLDARTLRMSIDASGQGVVGLAYSEYVALQLAPTLEELFQLHDWHLRRNSPTGQPRLPRTAKALSAAYLDEGAMRGWKQWRDHVLVPACRPNLRSSHWRSEPQLQKTNLPFPTDGPLVGIANTLRAELGEPRSAPEFNLGRAASVLFTGYDDPCGRICSWLHGTWLEHHLLDTLLGLVPKLKLHDGGQNIETTGVRFDVDVVALRGYQLFAFSCSTEAGRGEGGERLKWKLFEAFIRARQLGGDEARAAFVCYTDDPLRIEKEMRRDFDLEGRIRVFGRGDLHDLGTALTTWIESQSGTP